MAARRRRQARTLSEELKLSRPFPSVGTEAYLSLVRTAHLLQDETAALLRTQDLSLPQYNVLRILRGAGETGLPCLGVGERMVARVPDVTRLIGRLEDRGLVHRERSQADRRVVTVRITPEGLERLAGLDVPLRELHDGQLAPLSAKEQKLLLDLLQRLREPRT
ncbi:MAG: MarR family winged helix-turn-helix transcriptional regulator [Planctomycetota bacterium]